MKFKLFFKIISWLVTGIILVIASLTALSSFSTPLEFKIFVVESGSMSPVIQQGSLIIVKPEIGYKKGDIITFKKNAEVNIKERGATTTHRIIKIDKDSFITKGDVNKTKDQKPVRKDLVLGKLFLTIPFLGYPVSFAKTQIGLIFMIIIPATLIIYSEILNIKKEGKYLFLKWRKKRNKKKETRRDND